MLAHPLTKASLKKVTALIHRGVANGHVIALPLVIVQASDQGRMVHTGCLHLMRMLSESGLRSLDFPGMLLS